MAGLKKVKDTSFSDTVSQIEDEALRTLDLDSPSVSEDGFVHDVQMLYGFKDPETGILHNTFTYREMDGRDEEAIQKGDVRSNGAKLANVLVERCVISIGDFDKKTLGPKKWSDFVRKLYGGDIDYMMLKIREISKGDIVTFTHKCPNCNTKLITEMHTNEFKINKFKGEEEIPFSLPNRGYKDKKGEYHKEGVIRLTTGYDREIVVPLLMKNKSNGVTALLSRIITFNDGASIFVDNIKSMSLKDRDYLEKLSEDNQFGIEMTLDDVACTTCGYDLSDERAQSDFF